jgi:hypothetical protein
MEKRIKNFSKIIIAFFLVRLFNYARTPAKKMCGGKKWGFGDFVIIL